MEREPDTVFTGSVKYLSDDDIVFDPSGDIFRKNTEQYSSKNWYSLGKKANSYYWIPHDSLYTLKPRIGSEIMRLNTLSFTEEEIKLENGQESKYLMIYHCNNPGDLLSRHLKTRTFGIQNSCEWVSAEGQSHIVDKYTVSKDLREMSTYHSDICTNPLTSDPYEVVYPMENTSDTLSPWKTEEVLDGISDNIPDNIPDNISVHSVNTDSQETISDASDNKVHMDAQDLDRLDEIGGKTQRSPVKDYIDIQETYEEYRIDPWDNKWYTESEFKEYYGSTQEWDFQEPKKILIREELKQLAWDFRELSNKQFKCLLKTYQGTF